MSEQKGLADVKSFRSLAAVASLVFVSSIGPAASADAGADAAPTKTDGSVRDAGPLLDATATGDAVSTSDATLPPPTHAVGATCQKDADCAKGLTCLTSTTDSLGSGGPPNGLCSVSCAANGQQDCDRVDTNSFCAADRTGALRFCHELCDFGPPDGGFPKCHERNDMACSPSQSTNRGLCAPTCRGDYDCVGRVCDPGTGLCSKSVSGSLPFGSACDGSAQTTDCIGTCGTLGTSAPSTGNSFCTMTCALGRPAACGQDPNASGPPTAGCIFSFDSSEGDGDVGECGQLCDCDSDCKNPGFICSPNAGKNAGRAGACVPKLTFDGLTPGMSCGAGKPKPVSDAGSKAVHDDGGNVADATVDSGVGPRVSATGGCSCRMVHREPSVPPAAFLGLLVATFGLRRRSGAKRR